MKKLLCLLLSVLLVPIFAACSSENYDYIDETYDDTQSSTTPSQSKPSYDDAIRLMMKTFSNDFTEEELGQMFPDECWTTFQEKHGKSLSEIYETFSGQMAAKWAQTQQECGDGTAVKYEITNRIQYEGATYESFKTEMLKKYGISYDSFGICYEVTVKKATVGKLKENIETRTYHTIEIHGQWYVSEVLTDMLSIK